MLSLLKIGDTSLDAKCSRLWESEKFGTLSLLFIQEIAKIDDWDPSDDTLRMLYVLRRNQILCQALSQLADFPDPQDYEIEFIRIADCYSESISARDYFANPDRFPCASCTSEGRKYFCDIIIRPKQ